MDAAYNAQHNSTRQPSHLGYPAEALVPIASLHSLRQASRLDLTVMSDDSATALHRQRLPLKPHDAAADADVEAFHMKKCPSTASSATAITGYSSRRSSAGEGFQLPALSHEATLQRQPSYPHLQHLPSTLHHHAHHHHHQTHHYHHEHLPYPHHAHPHHGHHQLPPHHLHPHPHHHHTAVLRPMTAPSIAGAKSRSAPSAEYASLTTPSLSDDAGAVFPRPNPTDKTPAAGRVPLSPLPRVLPPLTVNTSAMPISPSSHTAASPTTSDLATSTSGRTLVRPLSAASSCTSGGRLAVPSGAPSSSSARTPNTPSTCLELTLHDEDEDEMDLVEAKHRRAAMVLDDRQRDEEDDGDDEDDEDEDRNDMYRRRAARFGSAASVACLASPSASSCTLASEPAVSVAGTLGRRRRAGSSPGGAVTPSMSMSPPTSSNGASPLRHDDVVAMMTVDEDEDDARRRTAECADEARPLPAVFPRESRGRAAAPAPSVPLAAPKQQQQRLAPAPGTSNDDAPRTDSGFYSLDLQLPRGSSSKEETKSQRRKSAGTSSVESTERSSVRSQDKQRRSSQTAAVSADPAQIERQLMRLQVEKQLAAAESLASAAAAAPLAHASPKSQRSSRRSSAAVGPKVKPSAEPQQQQKDFFEQQMQFRPPAGSGHKAPAYPFLAGKPSSSSSAYAMAAASMMMSAAAASAPSLVAWELPDVVSLYMATAWSCPHLDPTARIVGAAMGGAGAAAAEEAPEGEEDAKRSGSSRPRRGRSASTSSASTAAQAQQATPSEAFRRFVSHLVSITATPSPLVAVSLLYLDRLRKRRPEAILGKGAEGRVFLAAMVVANKMFDDARYTSKVWADVAGVELRKLNIMEAEFLAELRWDLHVLPEHYDAWIDHLFRLSVSAAASAAAAVTASSMAKVPSSMASNTSKRSIPKPAALPAEPASPSPASNSPSPSTGRQRLLRRPASTSVLGSRSNSATMAMPLVEPVPPPPMLAHQQKPLGNGWMLNLGGMSLAAAAAAMASSVVGGGTPSGTGSRSRRSSASSSGNAAGVADATPSQQPPSSLSVMKRFWGGYSGSHGSGSGMVEVPVAPNATTGLN
ncbi:hypothetical protein HDU96_001600 [Phlyctochytrium bullatum]|nr:hypothetical protein HDU96_001600 [Phlyctochytrium bullatum]